MELLVIVILLTVTVAQTSQLKGPENTLRVVGSNVTLQCLSPSRNCSGIEWMKYNAGNPMTIFNEYGIIFNAFRDRYSVENNSSRCDLIIENVQLTDAGRFICRALISSLTSETAAYLIILKTQLECQINASVYNTVEGDGVQLTCEVTYNGTSSVSMVWNGVTDAPASVENRNTISRSYSVVASAPEVPSFTCVTSFPIETKENGVDIFGLAKNIPNATCATPAVTVMYSVRDVTLSPSFSNYPPGTVIACAAKGLPWPTFKWQEMEDNGVWMNIQNQKSNEFSTTIVSPKRYRCVSMNVVRDKSYNASSQEFLVNNTGSEFGFGIGFGIGLLVAILLGTVVFAILVRLKYLEFHRRPANKPVDSGSQYVNHEMNPSSRQQSAVNPSIPRTGAPLVGEQESAYASLGEDRDANEYAALELKQKAKRKKKSTP